MAAGGLYLVEAIAFSDDGQGVTVINGTNDVTVGACIGTEVQAKT